MLEIPIPPTLPTVEGQKFDPEMGVVVFYCNIFLVLVYYILSRE